MYRFLRIHCSIFSRRAFKRHALLLSKLVRRIEVDRVRHRADHIERDRLIDVLAEGTTNASIDSQRQCAPIYRVTDWIFILDNL